jgi:hypothetical protein
MTFRTYAESANGSFTTSAIEPMEDLILNPTLRQASGTTVSGTTKGTAEIAIWSQARPGNAIPHITDTANGEKNAAGSIPFCITVQAIPGPHLL